MSPPIREMEIAFALEAAAHARAASELNSFGEAETLELGEARAVYCGQWSPVHGVFGLGLDGPVEERDLREVERFFLRKERHPAFWVCPETDSSLLGYLKQDFHPAKKVAVQSLPLHGDAPSLPAPLGDSRPDHQAWALAFTHALDPGAKEAGLLALTKLHQRETRFYLGTPAAASYTYFARGLALVPFPATPSLLSLQAKEAGEYRAKALVTAGNSVALPTIYERTLYERI